MRLSADVLKKTRKFLLLNASLCQTGVEQKKSDHEAQSARMEIQSLTPQNHSRNQKPKSIEAEPKRDHEHSDFQKSHDETEHHHHSSVAPHVHSEASLKQIINRLSRIEGHVRGIKTMVTESRPCPEVLMQIAAVRGAIDKVARIILDEHLSECIARAAQEGNIDTEIEELKAALDRFLP